VKRLLYEDGFTIKGARKFIRDNGIASVMDLGAGIAETGPLAVDAADLEKPATPKPAPPRPADAPQRQLREIIDDLENARAKLKSALEP
jgi:hypothetical protein